MKKLWLKATDEQTLIDALPFARGVSQSGVPFWIQGTHDFALDVIGDLYNNDAIYDESGDIVTPATKKVGFHVNIKCNPNIEEQIPTEIQILEPTNKQREWA